MDYNENETHDGNQQYGQQNQQYGQYNQQYGQYNQQPYMNNGYYEPQYGEVKDTFCNILLVVMVLRVILTMVMNIMTYTAMPQVSYESFLDGSYIQQMTIVTARPSYNVLSVLCNCLFIAFIVFIVLDIAAVRKANYKTMGLVLFAIFLTPGYYIWRAYILKRPKTVPVVYTVLYSVLTAVNIIVNFYYAYGISLHMMSGMQ